METYNDFINNILQTRGRFACGEKYHERHHIIPKCCGGTDDKDNLIDLFAHEHFIAHKLLALENLNDKNLIYAWRMMAIVKDKNQDRYELTPEEYEEVKIVYSDKLKERYQNPENHPMYGKHQSDESNKKNSESHKNISEETRRKMREAWKYRKPISEETRDKLKKAAIGNNNPRAKAVYCFELNEYFWGAKEAEEKYGICRSSISQYCKGKLGHAGLHPITGEELHWKYVEEENNEFGK